MKRKFSFLVLYVLCAWHASDLHAATFTWNGNGANDNWSTGANWTGGVPANDGTAAIVFAGNTRLAPNIDVAWSILGLAFNSGASSFTIGGSALTLGNSGITNSSNLIQSITAPIVIGSSQSWSATSEKLVIGSTLITSDTITLGANQLTLTGNNDIDLHGVISGTGGSVVKSGSGTLTITPNQTFTGGFAINGGIVDIGGSSLRLGNSGSSVTLNGGTLRTNNSTNLSQTFNLGGLGGTFESQGATPFISGKITGVGQLIKTGTANLRISNNSNDYSGGTLVNAGRLVAYEQALKGAVTNNGIVELGGSSAGSYGGTMTGSGTLVKSGASVFTLSGSSINLGGSLELQVSDLIGSGYSLIFGGNINIGAGNEIAFTGSGNTISAATINFDTSGHLSLGATLAGTSASAGAVTGAGTIDLGTNHLTLGVGNLSSTLAVVISGSGSLIKTGSGTLTITSNQNFMGGFAINGGIVDIGGSFLRLGPSNGAVSLNGGTLRTDGTTNLAQTFSIGASGGTFESLSGTPFISNPLIATGLLTKKGAGNLQLSDTNNNLSGGLSIEAGKLILSGNAGTGPVTNNGLLEFSGASSIDNRTVSGSGGIIKSGAGNLHHSQAVVDIGGSYLLNSGTITVAGSSITADGGISLADNTTLTTIQGLGDPTSDLNGGQLHVGANSSLILGGALGPTAWDTEAVFTDLTGTGTISLSTAGNARFTLSNPSVVIADVSFSGGNAAEQDGFIKTGAGELTLTANNSALNYLEIQQGTVIFSHISNLGGSVHFNGDATLKSAANLPYSLLAAPIKVTGAAKFDTDNQLISLLGEISGSGSITKVGSNSLYIYAQYSPFSGDFLINQGEVVASGVQVLGDSQGKITLAAGANPGHSRLSMENAYIIDKVLEMGENSILSTYPSTSGDWIGSADITLTGNATIKTPDRISGVNTFQLSGSGEIKGNSTLSLSVGFGSRMIIDREIDMGANSSVVKSGLGSLRLNGVMKTPYFRIELGTVTLEENALLPEAGQLEALAGSTLQLNDSDQVIGSIAGAGSIVLGTARLTTGGDDSSTTFGGVISGPGGLAKTGTGTLTLSVAQNYTGDTEVLAGTLALQEASLDDESDVILGPNATLHLDFTETDDIGGLIINGIRQPSGFWGAPGNPNAELTSPLLSGDGLLWIGTRIDYTWNGLGADNLWSSASNWIGGQAPPTNGRSGVIFDGNTRLAPENATPWHIVELVFAENASAFTLSGETLTIGQGGIQNWSTSTQTLTQELVANVAQTWSATNGPLVLGVPEGSIVSDDIVTLHTPHFINLRADWSGLGSIGKTGNGELLLTGTVDVTDLTITAGSLRLAASHRIANSTRVVIDEGGEWNLNGNNETLDRLESAGSISLGAGTLQVNGTSLVEGAVTGSGQLIANAGSGVLYIEGPATHTGGTFIQSGGIYIRDGGSIAGTVTAAIGSVLEFRVTTDSSYHGHFTGGQEAEFIQNSNSVLTLAGTTTHVGSTFVQSGTLKLGADNRISDTSDLIVRGIFDLAGFDETLLTIEGGGKILMAGGTLRFSSVGSYFYGAIRDPSNSGSLIKDGDGFWVLEKFFPDPDAGVLETGLFEVAEGSFTANDADISVNTMRVAEDATAFVNDGTWQSSAVELDGALTFENTGETPAVRNLGALSGDGTLTVKGPFNAFVTSLAGNGSVFLDGSAPHLDGATSFQFDHDNDQALGWSITGNVEVDESDIIIDGSTIFAKSGSGVLTIDQPLAQLAEIAVTEGTLAFSDVTDLGAQYLVLQNTGTLRVTATDQVLSLWIYGSGSPAIDTGVHGLETTGAILLFDDELRKTGSGELFVASGNIVAGSLRVEAGSMSFGAADMISNLVHVHLAEGTELKLEGNDQIVGTIEGGGDVILGGADLRLTAQEEEEEHVFAGMIRGVGGVSKSNGAGLTFTQAPAWLGDTTVIAGRLTLQQPGLDDDSDVVLELDGVLELDFSGTDTVDGFVIDGVRQVSGTWGAAGSGAQHETEQLSGSGLLYVRTAYESWIAQYYSNASDRGFNADPDNDGIPNGIEFVIGSLPRGDLESAAASRAKLPTFSRDGDDIVFVFRRTMRSAYLNPVVEHGQSLQSWSIAIDGDDGVTIDTELLDVETDRITVRIPLPVTIPGNTLPAQYFARLKATEGGP